LITYKGKKKKGIGREKTVCPLRVSKREKVQLEKEH